MAELQPIWQSRSVFVSGTFDDMHAERDLLATHVFPLIREQMLARKVDLDFVDLRWGIETTSLREEEAKHSLVLKVCLAEIARCRPHFIVLLGDRYGWVPPPERAVAAATEAALEVESSGMSVTALEIEFGAFAGNAGAVPLFYFRDPLPYELMSPTQRARYSDAVERPEAYARLQALKARIEQAYPSRVRRYTAGWDERDARPTGLDAFAERVASDVLQALTQDLPPAATETTDWRVQEGRALDAFVEERSTRAYGRTQLIEQLVSRCSAPPRQPSGAERPLEPILLLADAGLGKSTVFSRLVRALQQRGDSHVLSHSAGITATSTSVDGMLGRWCLELEGAAGTSTPFTEAPAAADLERRFFELLGAVASTKPVVILIDAIENFEQVPRASYLKWLPPVEDWPLNVTLLATSRGGSAAGILETRHAQRVGLEPLALADVATAADGICAEHHKQLPPAVRAAMLARLDGPHLAAGNPQWLTLVLGELLLLDADDFEELRTAAGAPDERLDALLIRTIERFPLAFEAAYGTVFARIEDSYGAEVVAKILVLLAVARRGLRETDLQALVPGYSAATFAAVRRAIRPHLSRDGAIWALSDPSARAAAIARRAPDEAQQRRLHAELGAHLESLDANDPLRAEMMHHLLEARDARALSKHWQTSAREAGFPALADFLLAQHDSEGRIDFVLSFLSAAHDEHAGLLVAIQMEWLLQFTEEARIAQASQEVAASLLRGAIAVLERTARGEHDAKVAQVISRMLRNLALVIGSPSESLELLQRSGQLVDELSPRMKKFLDQLATDDPKRKAAEIFYHEVQRDRMLNCERVALLLREGGDLARALKSMGTALPIGRYFVDRFPRSPLAVRDAARGFRIVGTLLFDEGNFDGAHTYFTDGARLAETFLANTSDDRIADLAISCRLDAARALRRLRAPKAALDYVARAFGFLRESAENSPEDADRQVWFLEANDEIADALALGNAFDASFQCYVNALKTCQRMLALGQRRSAALHHLKRCALQLALISEIMGDEDAAREHGDRAALE